jgi:hypothetical protein
VIPSLRRTTRGYPPRPTQERQWLQRRKRKEAPGWERNLFWKENLIDDNVVSVDVRFGELLHKTLSFINRKKFWNTNANKSCQVRVLDLVVHLTEGIRGERRGGSGRGGRDTFEIKIFNCSNFSIMVSIP